MTKPNIILINCDDLGYGDLGCYGSDRNDTPHIDRLAEEGLRFTDFYVASPICSPSRGAMLTGCYPPRIGFAEFSGGGVLFPGNPDGLNPDEITIARLLKGAGYKTKLVGKWHCGDQPEFLPTEHGFDDYFGIPYSNDMGRQKYNDGTVSTNPPLPLMRGSQVDEQQPDQRGLTERYADECVRFIEESKDEAFFLYLAHMYVHVPLFVPRQFLDSSRNGAYGGAVSCIDWTTGVIMDALRRHGLDDNTLVVFTSDNGSRASDEGGSNAPCRGTKGTTWEGGQRVPCVMRWPGGIEAGQECAGVASTIDFYPTLARLAGVEIPADRIIDGVDMSEILLTGTASPRESFVFYRLRNLEAVRVGDWKLHFRKGNDEIHELYNLAEDVGEAINLYDQHPDIARKLSEFADTVREDMGDASCGIEGANNRPVGMVDRGRCLTEYDENHPYVIALYDLADSKVMAG